MADTARLRHLATIRNSNVDKKSLEGEQAVRLCNYTDVYYSDRIDPASEFMTATATQDEIDRFTLRRSQVLMTKDSETADDIGIPAFVPCDMPGVICGYHLTQITPGDGLDGRFLAWCLMSKKLAAWFEVSARGVTRFGLGQDAVNDAPIPAQSLNRQARIANFLDRETARIDALVDKKRRLVDLLEEKRTATITQAVTKGLDPTVPMKDSGIPWIGEVPAHWSVGSMRRILNGTYSGGTPKSDDERFWTTPNEGIPFVAIADMSQVDQITSTARNITCDGLESKALRVLEPGSLLLAMYASVGETAFLAIDATINQAILALDAQPEDRPWLRYWLQAIRPAMSSYARSNTQDNLSAEVVRDLPVIVPPESERREIAEVIDGDAEAISATSAKIAHQVGLLAEYRESLITAAVTGEIDVDTFNGEEQMEEVAG